MTDQAVDQPPETFTQSHPLMKQIVLLNPARIVFGDGAFSTFADDFLQQGLRRLFVITIAPLTGMLKEQTIRMKGAGIEVCIDTRVEQEPDFEMFEQLLEEARLFGADAVAGIGGGSVLDVAKLLAAFIDSDQQVRDTVGIGLLAGRKTWLACLPTTSGTGSEVSPNAILLDKKDQLKKGVVSPWLVPDVAYVDPELTWSVPATVTASTGLDALTHCLEAYTNTFAHPMIDLYALEGIRLINKGLVPALRNGRDRQARGLLSLGSLYGGYCLGPVNTAAVHALSYPLGGMFHVAHGLSNAILLPHVMEFNLPAAPDRYAEVARALGADEGANEEATARNGVGMIHELMKKCGIPTRLSELNIPQKALDDMADGAIKVTRLLRNNVREVTRQDALELYKKAW
jgi:alcohol dehydrogenase